MSRCIAFARLFSKNVKICFAFSCSCEEFSSPVTFWGRGNDRFGLVIIILLFVPPCFQWDEWIKGSLSCRVWHWSYKLRPMLFYECRPASYLPMYGWTDTKNRWVGRCELENIGYPLPYPSGLSFVRGRQCSRVLSFHYRPSRFPILFFWTSYYIYTSWNNIK